MIGASAQAETNATVETTAAPGPQASPDPQSRAGADTDVETAARLRTAVGRLARRIRPTRVGAGLTLTEATVLATVTRRGPVGLSWLTREEGMNPTMLSRVIWRLEDAGLLARRPDPRDRRAALVEATPAGRRLHERIRAERTDALSQLIEQLDAGDRAALTRAVPVLEQLARDLKERRL
ncbi:MAG TPA: MarR family transcriptional regulator [Streptosporangiaceae bacterium]|nr:MarR family transcriptional regulator [Streptosporangiaceae bacterium]